MGCAGLGCNMRRACTRRRHWAWISPPYLPAASKHPVTRLHPLVWACDCHCACVALCCKSTQRLQLCTDGHPAAGHCKLALCGELQALASAFHTQLPHPHTMREKQYIDIHMLTQQLLSSLAAGGHRDHPQLHSSRGHGHRQQAGPSSAQTHTAQKALPRRTPYARPRTATEPRAPPEGLALIRRERGRDMRGGPAPSCPSLPSPPCPSTLPPPPAAAAATAAGDRAVMLLRHFLCCASEKCTEPRGLRASPPPPWEPRGDTPEAPTSDARRWADGRPRTSDCMPPGAFLPSPPSGRSPTPSNVNSTGEGATPPPGEGAPGEPCIPPPPPPPAAAAPEGSTSRCGIPP